MWGRTQKDGTQSHNNSEAGQLSAGIPLKADMSLAIEPIEFGFQLLNFGMKILAGNF